MLFQSILNNAPQLKILKSVILGGSFKVDNLCCIDSCTVLFVMYLNIVHVLIPQGR